MKYFIKTRDPDLGNIDISKEEMETFHKIVMMYKYPINPNNRSYLHEFAQNYGKDFMMLFLKIGLMFNAISESKKDVKVFLCSVEDENKKEKELLRMYNVNEFFDFCEKEFFEKVF